MKFKTYLEQIAGVDIYPMASLMIFFIFFTVLSIWALRVNRKHINNLKHIPFSEQ